MTLQINGKPHEVRVAGNVRELVEELGLPMHALLIEHNGIALRPGEWPSTFLADEDRIEIIRIVAGG